MNIRDAAPVVAAIVFAGALGAGVIALTASGSPEPAAGATRMAPRCFETSVNGSEDCAWVPVAQCLTDEAGDEAIPASYEGCYWDAQDRGNRTGTSYVIWRQNRG